MNELMKGEGAEREVLRERGVERGGGWRERERQRNRQTDRQTDRQTEGGGGERGRGGEGRDGERTQNFITQGLRF